MSGSTIVANGNTLDVSGIIPFETIELQGTTANTDLALTADTTLNDSGTILLDGADSRIYGSSSAGNTLDNVNGTIEGAGSIGINSSGDNLALINESAGTIDADGTVPLALQLSGSPAAANAGLIEATNTGGLLIQDGAIDDFIGALVGTIAAIGTGAVVDVQNSDIAGGTLETSGGGVIEAAGGTTNTLDGSVAPVTITAGSTVELANSSTLFLNGTIDNAGTILDATTGNDTDIQIAGGDTVSLTGGGVLDLAGINARIFGTSGTAAVLDNIDNTIEGAGSIGVNSSGVAIAVVNQPSGTINANATAALILELSGSPALINAGLLEATGSGELAIQNGVVTNFFENVLGTVAAVGSAAVVSLQDSDIAGGVLTTSGGGLIETAPDSAGNTLDGSTTPVTITTGSTVELANSSTLFLNGTIDTAGTILDAAGGDDTDIRIDGGNTVSLTGGGVLDLAGINARIWGSSGTAGVLDNFDTIEGAGSIGVNNAGLALAVVNEAGGTIDASSTAGLILQLTGSTLSNDGLLEDTGTGGLSFANGTEIDNTGGGTILASGTGASVLLSNGVVLGGVLETSGGGIIEGAPGTTNTLDGSVAPVTITTGSTVELANSSTLFLNGTIDTAGTILDDAGGNDTDIRITGGDTVSLSSGGVVDLAGINARIFGTSGTAAVLENFGTIEGAGSIGVNNAGLALAVINEAGGTIDASSTAGLILQLTGSVFTNDGLLEDTGTGGLSFSNGTEIDNTGGGTILASGTGASVLLSSGVVLGGVLETSGGGIIEGAGGTTNTLDGSVAPVTITSGSTVELANSSTLFLNGTIDTAGTILDATTGDDTDIRITGGDTVSLSSGGVVDLAGINARIFGTSGTAAVLENFGTIEGAGSIGVNNAGLALAVVNEAGGTIDASSTAGLILQLTGSVFTNDGLLEDTGTGGLSFAASTVIDNTGGGTILASGTGASVVLSNGGVLGGTLDTSNGGVIEAASGTTNTLDGSVAPVTITAGSTVELANSSVLFLNGTIDTAGTILDDAGGNDTDIRITGGDTFSLTGAGVLDLAGVNARIFGTSGTPATLANFGTIEGAGSIGVNNSDLALAVINEAGGTIDASSTATLLIEPGGPAVTNAGVMEGTGSGGLEVNAATIINTGTVQALDGSNVTFDTDVTTTNNSAGTLTGGTWGAYSTGDGSHVDITGGAVTDDAATIILSGSLSTLDAYNGSTYVAIEQSLTAVDTGGTLDVLDDRDFTSANSLTDSGLITLGGGFFQAPSLDITGSGTVDGFGTLTPLDPTNDGTIVANTSGATLLVGSPITGTGDLVADAGATLDLASSVASTQTLVVDPLGTVRIDDPASFTAGTILNFAPGATLDFAGEFAVTTVSSATISGGSLDIVVDGTSLSYALTTPDPLDRVAIIPNTTNGDNVVVYRIAQASSVAPNPVAFGEQHVGATVSQLLTIANTDTNDGYSENLDSAFTSASGGIGATGSITGLAAGSTSSALGLTLATTADGVISGSATLADSSDGTGVDGNPPVAIGTQTITATGTVFNLATASAAAPNPVAFGEHHVGDVVTQTFTIANTATADGFSENLNAGFTGASAGITTGGTASELGAGSSSTGLNATIDLTSGGVFAGAATLGLISDGSTIDTLGTTALPSQTIGVGGTAYNYATASVSPTSLAFGEAHVGDTVTQALTIANTAPADGFSENLDASVSGSGAVTGSGGVSGLGAGTSIATAPLTLDTTNAGSLSGSVTIGLTSDGSTIDTLGTTALPSQTIAASGDVFRLATASVPGSIDFGIVHVGDTVSDAITIANTDPADGFSENLDATAGSAATGFTLAGTADEIGAGSSSDALTATLDTATAGTFSGDGTIGLVSDGSTIDTLGTTALPDATISLDGTVLNYATAALDQISGTGSLSGSAASGYTLDLGSLVMGGTADTADLGVLNTAIGPADTLAGSFAESGSGFSFSGTDFAPFSGVLAGGSADAGTINFDPVSLGTYFETITLDPTGSDPSFSGTLAPVTMLVEADVTCFLAGTRIGVPGGEVPVESLGIGDLVVTASGVARPIRWIGSRSYAGRFVARNRRVLPILIRAGALGDNLPRRDLYVSPNHAMYLGGMLIPAVGLVNGGSVVQVERMDLVAYFHIELDTHDVLLAEGAPAESFADDESRHMFHNAGEYWRLYPEAARLPARYCAPRVEDGEELEAARERLAARAVEHAGLPPSYAGSDLPVLRHSRA